MVVALHWREDAPYGPGVEFLIAAQDMGEVRAQCDLAALYYGPPDRKRDSLGTRDPLRSIAEQHPGQLLWRLDGEDDWRVGAESAAEWRSGHIDQVNSTIDEARSRRRGRRHSR